MEIPNKQRAKHTLVKLLIKIGYQIVPNGKWQATSALSNFANNLMIAAQMNPDITVAEASDLATRSKSQIGQDVFAITSSGMKQRGYFVEFGATNGIDLSNTYMLEKHFGWTGILAEPAIAWQTSLKKNRDCIISTHCVWHKSDQHLDFFEAKDPELSTISKFSNFDKNSLVRKKSKKYKVPTITLFDLLEVNGAPRFIDFLSMDTEGSEFEILEEFDFERYTFGSICVEHNFSANRVKIFDLLSSKGYVRVLAEISDFDDWYVHSSIK